ncbi:MAG: flagellar biosynthetic protein FliO [Verrucomicrobia bacterium]|nr:flagellar biosynthetic protein FliO [Verrucomicrobiota bacterium]
MNLLRPLYIFLFISLCHFAYAEETSPQQVETVTGVQAAHEEKPAALDAFDKENESREKAEEGKFSELWSKSLFLLAIAIAALFIATWFMKRMDYFKPHIGPKDARIKLLEKRMLSAKSCMYLLEVDGHKMVVTESLNGTQQPYELKTS